MQNDAGQYICGQPTGKKSWCQHPVTEEGQVCAQHKNQKANSSKATTASNGHSSTEYSSIENVDSITLDTEVADEIMERAADEAPAEMEVVTVDSNNPNPVLVHPNQIIDLAASVKEPDHFWDTTDFDPNWTNDKTPEEITLGVCLAANIPVMLWGDPGAGKTSLAVAIGAALGMPVQDADTYKKEMETGNGERGVFIINASTCEPSDFAGLPVVPPEILSGRRNGQDMTREQIISAGTPYMQLPPPWAYQLAQHGGILFLDEITSTSSAVLNSLRSVVQDRRLGPLFFGDDVRIILAGNLPDDVTTESNDMPSPFANRMAHITIPSDDLLQDGKGIARAISAINSSSGVAPDRRSWPRISKKDLQEAADYIMPSFLMAAGMDGAKGQSTLAPAVLKEAKKPVPNKPFMTNRSCAMAIMAMAAARHTGVPSSNMVKICQSLIGEGAGANIAKFVNDHDIPSVPELVAGGSKGLEKYKDKYDKKFLISSMLSVYLNRTIHDTSIPKNEKQKVVSDVFGVVGGVAEKWGDDLAVQAMRKLTEDSDMPVKQLSGLLTPEAQAVLRDTILPILKRAGLMPGTVS